MKQTLYMRDFLTLRVSATDSSKKYIHECKDSASESGYSLLVHVDATHAGVVNGNARFYRPDMMANSAHTWGGTKWSKRPVLAHHNEDSDPLGRVATWKYVDERHLYMAKYGQINNLHFFDSVTKNRLDLFKSVNWVYDNLQKKNKDYTGLGKIQLGLNITNPDAIGKVQREEYTTVSVGFKTDAALCSICHQDWGTDGRCEHRLGSLVDGERCFLISGNQDFQELSFVTFPADRAGVVINHEVVQAAKDSMALRSYFLGHSFEEVSTLHQTDAVSDLIESDISIATDEKENDMDLDALRAEIASQDLTQERALELRAELTGQKDAKRVLNTLNAKIRKNSWDTDTTVLAPSKEEVEIKIAALADLATTMEADAYAAHLAQVTTEAEAHSLELPAVPASDAVAEEATAGEQTEAQGGELLAAADSEAGAGFAGLVTDLSTAYKSLPEEEKYIGRQLLYQIWDILGDEDMAAYYKVRLSSKEDATDALVSKSELDSLHDGIEAFEGERKTLQSSLTVARDTNKTLVAQLKRTIATAVVTYAVLSNEAGFEGLDAAGIEAEIAERSQRQLVSLQDSLKDLQKKLHISEANGKAPAAQAPVEEAVEVQAADATVDEGVRDVSDTAKVQDTTDQPQSDSVSESNADAPEVKAIGVRPFATLADIQALSRRLATDTYQQLKRRSQDQQKD